MMTRELSILTVDDEEPVNFSIRSALGGPARTLVAARDGEDALEQIKAKEPPFDLVVIDHKMPRVNGLELVRRLREIPFGGKIIVLSAHLNHDVRRSYEAMNVDVMLSKPFDLRELRDAVEQVVREV
jgi:CheY-like chemotaxis protein